LVSSDTNTTKGAARAIYWILSLGLAGVLLYYSLRGIDWVRVWGILRGAAPVPVSIAAVAVLTAVFLRAIRWRVLLSAERNITPGLAFWATSAGYLGNNVLPARAGEVVRTLMISRRSGLSKAFVLTTALSERVADAIALITISAAVLLTAPEGPGWLARAARPFAVVGLLGVAAIAFLPAFERFYFRFLAYLPVPDRIRAKVENALRQGIQGIRSFHDSRRLALFLGLTIVIWCTDAVTAILCARALALPLTIPVAFLFIAGLGLGSALPSTPGYVGIYQFVAVSVLTPFGMGRSDAIAFVLLFQAISYAVILVMGSIGLAKQRGESAAAAAAPASVAPPTA
jgi:uncharacterized protein (TIRG00374 family)